MSERFQMIDGVMRDTNWACRIEPEFRLPKFPAVEAVGIRAVLSRYHRYMPFPCASRYPTTRAT